MKWIFLLILIPSLSFGSSIFNPGSGSGGSVTPGSTNYIQNTFTPTTTMQVFSVYKGSFSVAGFYMHDADGCEWVTTIATTGALVTTRVKCPLTGQCIGILCGVTYN